DICRECADGYEAVGVSHGLSCILAGSSGTVAARGQLRRLRLRQSNPRGNRVAGPADWRSVVPDELCAGVVVHHLLAKARVRGWLFDHGVAIPARETRSAEVEAIPSSGGS